MSGTFFAVVVLALGPFAGDTHSAKAVWLAQLEEAQRLAKKDGKPILIREKRDT